MINGRGGSGPQPADCVQGFGDLGCGPVLLNAAISGPNRPAMDHCCLAPEVLVTHSRRSAVFKRAVRGFMFISVARVRFPFFQSLWESVKSTTLCGPDCSLRRFKSRDTFTFGSFSRPFYPNLTYS